MGESSHDPESREDPLDARIGQIFNDFLDRKARGEAVSEADLLAEHPEYAEELKDYFDLVQDLRPGEESIDRLIEQSILKRLADTRYLAELGPYKITGLLGRGGMGIVLKAHEESLDRTVALKILRPELADDKTALGRFTREAKAAALLRHPNIVTVHAVGEQGGTHFIAMEHIEGPTLADLIRERGALPAELIRTVFDQMLKGLSAAHEAGLIHRDIKPSNVLLDHLPDDALSGDDAGVHDANSFIVKIADFGLARMVAAQTRMTMPDSVFGTPEYMSPEQARGDEDIDHRTDLHSAGVVLYEMLTGRTPFMADTPTAVIHQILHNEPRDPRTVSDSASPHLASLALRLMAKRPEDRPGSAAESLALHRTRLQESSKYRLFEIRRYVRAVLLTLALVSGATWLITQLNWQPVIKSVEIKLNQTNQNTSVILAYYGDESSPRLFFDKFPEDVKSVDFAEAADGDGDGINDLVVAGIASPWTRNCLFGIDTDGKLAWNERLADGRKWPDCPTVSPTWVCTALDVGNLDGIAGDEILVVAHAGNNDYPTRISIINPDDGVTLTTFWHIGHISGVLIEHNFFGPNQPAIVAWGVNNKLDGFKTHTPGEDPLLSPYDFVPVIMVLDPRKMNGIGPPRTPLLDHLSGDNPFAYAFLDLPNSIDSSYVPDGETQPRNPLQRETARIKNVTRDPQSIGGGSCSWWVVDIAEAFPIDGEPRNHPGLVLDRTLSFCAASPTQGEIVGSGAGFWRALWHPIIANHKYVGD